MLFIPMSLKINLNTFSFLSFFFSRLRHVAQICFLTRDCTLATAVLVQNPNCWATKELPGDLLTCHVMWYVVCLTKLAVTLCYLIPSP